MNDEEKDLTEAQILRIKAEEQLKDNQKTGEPAIETDMKRLLHELQVHQIELEMQNEELRKANETAETALRKFTLLYDLAPMGYFILDEECSIKELNFTGAKILNDKRISLLNSNFKLFVSEESLPAFNDFFKKVFISDSKQSCELVLGYGDNPRCPVYMEGVIADDEWKCLLSVLDLTEFKKQEKAK
jgi:PAS domain-containing protein